MKQQSDFLKFAINVEDDTLINRESLYNIPRVILESTLIKLAEKFPSLESSWIQQRTEYLEKDGKKNIRNEWRTIDALKWLGDNARANGIPYNHLLNQFYHTLRIATNYYSQAHQKSTLDTIYLYPPTINSSKAILYIMCDIIIWFGKVLHMEK